MKVGIAASGWLATRPLVQMQILRPAMGRGVPVSTRLS